jgi:hypothetical protein
MLAGCGSDSTTVIGTPLAKPGQRNADAGTVDTGIKPDIPFSGCTKPTDCPLSGPCKVGVCKSNGVCGEKDEVDGTPCEDGDPYNLKDFCGKGLCDGKGKLDCDDAEPCTVDTCILFVGCAHEPASEGAACTLPSGPGSCVNGLCKGA